MLFSLHHDLRRYVLDIMFAIRYIYVLYLKRLLILGANLCVHLLEAD